MTQTCLSHKQRLLVAGTLFGMFFGAGNLIFPVHLGQLAGRQFLPAAIGFIRLPSAFRSWCCRDRKHAFGGTSGSVPPRRTQI